jgi:hypothetical protein
MKKYFDEVSSSKKNGVSFLMVGKTQESKEAGEGGFKRYVGVGSTFVKGVQPSKKEIDEFFGFESQSEPEYLVDTDNGKELRITFLIQTDPETCNGIELKSRAMFTLRQAAAYNRDQTKCEVIDQYGNHTWISTEDAKAGKAILKADGNPQKIDTKYRIACVGECDLVDFLKKYLCVPDAFNYVNGVWMKKEDADNLKFGFTTDDIKAMFSGNFKDLKDAIAMQPNNKVKLLYGVRTNDEGKQYQAVCTRGELILANAANVNALTKLEKDLANAKQNGAYQNIDYRVCELQEWTVEPTNLEAHAGSEDSSASDMPWD